MHDILILLRIELKRLFKSKLFYVSLFIGLALSVGGLSYYLKMRYLI